MEAGLKSESVLLAGKVAGLAFVFGVSLANSNKGLGYILTHNQMEYAR